MASSELEARDAAKQTAVYKDSTPPQQKIILPQMSEVPKLRNLVVKTSPSCKLITAIYKASSLQKSKFQRESNVMHNEGFTRADTIISSQE